MLVEEIESTARLDEVGHHAGPRPEIGQPHEHAQGGGHHVEPLLEHLRQIIDVGADEAGIQSQLLVQTARQVDRGTREVDPGGAGAEPCPGHRVHAEVALQVQQGFARDRADLLTFDPVDGDPPRLEALHVVEGGGGVHGNPFIPVAAVDLPALVHLDSAPQLAGATVAASPAGVTPVG